MRTLTVFAAAIFALSLSTAAFAGTGCGQWTTADGSHTVATDQSAPVDGVIVGTDGETVE